MFGLEAIAAYNGWSQAFAGACIVMLGLIVLCFVISQLHRITNLMEKSKDSDTDPDRESIESGSADTLHDRCPADIHEAAKLYMPLTKELGESFELADLYRVFTEKDLPHPHITIKNFREAGVLIPVKDGVFSWSK